MGDIVVLRHGSTEWSESGRHTGTTDVELTADGERQAAAWRPELARHRFALVLASPLRRARRTAELAGFADPQVDRDLVEWDYGAYDGLTTAQISERLGRPWSLWRDGVVPGATPGETVEQVAARAAAVLERVRPATTEGDVLLVAHGHLLRVLAATWLGLPPRAGALFALSAASLGSLGHEHGVQVVQRWNLPAGRSLP